MSQNDILWYVSLWDEQLCDTSPCSAAHLRTKKNAPTFSDIFQLSQTAYSLVRQIAPISVFCELCLITLWDNNLWPMTWGIPLPTHWDTPLCSERIISLSTKLQSNLDETNYQGGWEFSFSCAIFSIHIIIGNIVAKIALIRVKIVFLVSKNFLSVNLSHSHLK